SRLQRSLETAREATGAALQHGEGAEAWVGGVRRLAEALGDAVAWRSEASAAVTAAEAELERAELALRAGEVGRSVRRSTLELQIHARTAGPVRVRTVVPCALWRPVHRATLRTVDRGGERDEVLWEVRAAIWNRTGIDWDGVPVVVSTARPGQRAEAPRLVDDNVGVARRGSEVVVEAREEVVDAARSDDEVRQTATLPGVDDGGEVRVYAVEAPVTVPSDGRPVFVELERFDSPCRTSWRCVPSLSPQAVLRSAQANRSSRPLLAGPVELLRDGEGVGRGSIGLVPPGEPFALGWGSHDAVRVVRRQDHERETATLTGTQTHTFEVEVRVANLGRSPLVLHVDERVPVSELKAVSVDLGTCAPALQRQPDRDGLCGWTLELGAGEIRELSMAYRVTASRNVRLPF
ncbi:MAG: DUF4139 domain-containing protein, partial [Myxococcales bacterium]|nr:DUF4139 domain-containing protein [Myxococcales bacterium]